jgi:hypothetical protein
MCATAVREPIRREPARAASLAEPARLAAFAATGPVCTACEEDAPCPACAATGRRGAEPWPGWAQPKLRVQQPADPLEAEADAIAASVTGLAPPRPSPGLRRFAPAAPPDAVAGMLQGGGRPLDPELRSYFEDRLGHDLAAIRLHDGGAAAATAEAMGARAYAVGHDLVFGAGEYRPDAPDGRRLLAHELVHNLQQGGAPARRADAPAVSSAPRAVAREPRSLTETVDAHQLSDRDLLFEAEEIRDWLASHSPDEETRALLAAAIATMLEVAVARAGVAPEPMPDVAPAPPRAAEGPEASAGPEIAEGFVGPVPLRPPVTAPPVTAPPGPGLRPLPPLVTPRPPPIPLLVAIFILVWPNDSIVSGEEERRLLEEARRAQAAREPTAGPAPAPAPGARRHPNQTCDDATLDAMQAAMHAVCDRIPGESCSPKKVSLKKLARRPCSQIRIRILAVRECMRLRQAIQDDCFGGQPDAVHQGVMDELASGLEHCLALERVNCAPGHPMADL